jgi:hypothetical protein
MSIKDMRNYYMYPIQASFKQSTTFNSSTKAISTSAADDKRTSGSGAQPGGANVLLSNRAVKSEVTNPAYLSEVTGIGGKLDLMA